MKIIRIVAAAALACMSVGANAAPLLFNLTGGYEARFELDSDILPDVVDDNRFEVNDVDGTLAGRPARLGTIAFFVDFIGADPIGGGFNITNGLGNPLFEAEGPMLFTGGTDRPTFLTGTFDLFKIGADRNRPAAYSLTISAISAIPEPGVWLTMIVGLSMVGVVIRRRAAPRSAVA